MGSDRSDNFPFDFVPNRTPFGSTSKGELSLRSYPIQYERKWESSFLSVTKELFKSHLQPAVLNSVFIYVEKFDQQIGELGMGLPLGATNRNVLVWDYPILLGPTFANISMCHHDIIWL